MKFTFSLILALSIVLVSSCQKKTDSEIIDSIFKEALNDSSAYDNLKYLTTNYPDRIACSPTYHEAAIWAKDLMNTMNFSQVFFQEATVKNWDRGIKETAQIISNIGIVDVNVLALGRGIGTGIDGISGNVVAVQSFEELEKLGKNKIKGKIVFYNRPMIIENGNVFGAYGKAVPQRFDGPNKAAEYGAIGAIIRSVGSSTDEFPHTGVTGFSEDIKTVPAVAIATRDADLLTSMLEADKRIKFKFTTTCENRPDTISYNIIGEIKGSKFPNKIITIGGHFDAWGPGAHDDGAACLQALEVARIFQKLKIKPRHTIRIVLFADEEISQGGAKAYALEAKEGKIEHMAAIESDRGVEKPLGFTIHAKPEQEDLIKSWSELFKSHDITVFQKGYGGVDINVLNEFGTVLLGYLPESVHYFDWHHAPSDTWDKVKFEHMQNGSASIASMVYLIDKYGL